jgi:hypothetical protein
MHIFILKTNYNVTDKYCVIIGDNVFYMSEYANRANEVNMYSGRITTTKQLHALMENAIILKHIPTNLKLAIRERCKQTRRDELQQYHKDDEMMLNKLKKWTIEQTAIKIFTRYSFECWDWCVITEKERDKYRENAKQELRNIKEIHDIFKEDRI